MICFECKAEFSDWESLAEHQKSHTSKYFSYPYFIRCHWCDDRLRSMHMARRHMRFTHPYNCLHCVKVLPTWEDFKKHAEICKFAKDEYEQILAKCGPEKEMK